MTYSIRIKSSAAKSLNKLPKPVRERRDEIDLISQWAVRPDDLLQALNEHRPHIVHFSAHGLKSDEILLHDDDGRPAPVRREALVSLFRSLRDDIRLVVLRTTFRGFSCGPASILRGASWGASRRATATRLRFSSSCRSFPWRDSSKDAKRCFVASPVPTSSTFPQASEDAVFAAVLGWLRVYPGWLLIVDNVDNVDNEEAMAAVYELLPRLSGVGGGDVAEELRAARRSGAGDIAAAGTHGAGLRRRALGDVGGGE
jgi:hypothetical protein